eukprot:454890-Amorphochlora_amoeboformis.AAC.2
MSSPDNSRLNLVSLRPIPFPNINESASHFTPQALILPILLELTLIDGPDLQSLERQPPGGTKFSISTALPRYNY